MVIKRGTTFNITFSFLFFTHQRENSMMRLLELDQVAQEQFLHLKVVLFVAV